MVGGQFRETKREIIDKPLNRHGFSVFSVIWSLFHGTEPFFRGVCFWKRTGLSLRVIEVNTLEPLLKTLTPWQTLVAQGFAADWVNLFGKRGEPRRDAAVMGFGDTREHNRETM